MSKFEQLLRENKEFIRYGMLYNLHENYQVLVAQDIYIDYSRLFKELFIQACYYNQALIAEWLYREIYLDLPIISQIGLRPVFNYCHHLTVKRKYPELAKWVHSIQLEVKNNLGIVSI